MSRQIPVDPRALAEEPNARGPVHEIAPGLAYRRLGLVNVMFCGEPGSPGWVLVDAGVSGTRDLILRAAAERFGEDVPPAAIVLTHGHFDHVGALEDLAARWDVPVFAHALEHPFLDGRSSYPSPDPGVGGIMARLSPLYPRGPVDVSRHLEALPGDGSIPAMPGWRWIHTPGHSPGHVSLWREADRTLVAGDAVITTRQESAYAVAAQTPEIHGPPQYFTPDWPAAARSATALAGLDPDLLVTGHGPAMHGPDMRKALHDLAEDFFRIAVPKDGRYAPE